MLPDTFRDNFRAAVLADPRPIKAIASAAGYSESHVRRIMHGAKENPTLLFVHCLAQTLGIDPILLLQEPIVRSELIRTCAVLFDVSPQDLISNSRIAAFIPARFAMYKAMRMRGLSFAQIGRMLKRDHKTVRYGVLRATDMMQSDTDYAAKVIRLSRTNVYIPTLFPVDA